jgi:protein involved in polysaccharide export with SLBB domain
MLPLGNIRIITLNNIVYRFRRFGFLFLVLGLFFSQNLFSQILSLQDQLTTELEKHGLEYQEVREALFIRGYDIENMTELNPDQVDDIREIMQFLIAQKQAIISATPSIDTIVTDSLSLDDIDEVLDDESDPITEDEEEGPEFYGHNLYKSGQFKPFEPIEDLLVPANYTLGVGDEIVISIFGRNAQLEQEYRIGEDGTIRVNDGRNRVSLSGLTLIQAERRLTDVFQNFMIFRKDEFNVKVRGSKTVRVEIFGEVNEPGAYVLSAFNSVYSAISEAQGPTDAASLRNIRLIRANGDVEILDLYEWITRPENRKSIYLDNGDIIHVPISSFRVQLDGEVRRPMLYDGKEGEGIMDILEYAGGLSSNAYLNNFQLVRQDGIERSVLDIEYLRLFRSGQDFELNDGDIITISAIADELENYVRISGEVRNEGDYQLIEGMNVYDLLQKAKLKESSRTDIAYLIRRGENDLFEIEALNIDEIINDRNSSQNFVLRSRDEIVIYTKSRFTDDAFVIISGAVRFPDSLNHDASGSLRITDYLNMVGGMKKEAASFAHVYRRNPINPSIEEYKRVDLKRAYGDPNSVDNITLEPYDSVYVYSLEDFAEERTIQVSGAVNNPGEFTYGQGMTLADAIILAGGFRLSSATNKIEVSRVLIEENKPTSIQVNKVNASHDINALAQSDNDVELMPFDIIFVRDVPEFELQQVISIEGEVRLPGEYSLIKSNETVYDLVNRAGGVTEEAFLAGAQLYRQEDSLGYIVMRLDEVLDDPRSKYNYSLKDGDIISVPERKDYVTIRGATRAVEAVDRDILGPNNEISVPYHPKKNAKFYIDYYAGGFAPRADKKKVFVRHPNGEVRQVEKRALVANKYPEVREGSVITVGYKEVNLLASKEDDKVDFTKVLGDSVGQAMSILTLILLIQRLE